MRYLSPREGEMRGGLMAFEGQSNMMNDTENPEAALSRKNRLERLKFLEEQKRKTRNDTAGMVFNSTIDTGAMSVRPHSLFRRKEHNDDISPDLGDNTDEDEHTHASPKADRNSKVSHDDHNDPSHDMADSPTSSVRNLRLHRSASLEMSTIEKELLNRGISAVYDPTEASDNDEPEAIVVKAQTPPVEDASSPQRLSVSNAIEANAVILKSLLKDKGTFVTRPAPMDMTVRCRIKRTKKDGKNPSYSLFVELSDKGTKEFILQAKKRSKNKTSNYIITDQSGENPEVSSAIAKLRSNFLGSEYVLFDNGVSPRVGARSKDTRKEICSMSYETNPFGLKGPRKMVVVIPLLKEDDSMMEFLPKSSDSRLLGEKRTSRRPKKDGVIILMNKSPVWKEETQSFVLNFNGRVTLPSVKNFQIVCEENVNDIILQFGRVGEDSFTLDYKHPMSAVQAFGIALSSFDGKLACE